jgi:heme/copper-type cytochrome/quinol oxidase subunit 3
MNHPDTVQRTQSDDRLTGSMGMGTFGMVLFLLALTMLFGSTIFGYLYLRSGFETWPPPESPSLPAGLWLSTVLILAASGTIHWALHSVRWDRRKQLLYALLTTSLLGVAFLVNQAANWYDLMQAVFPPGHKALVFTSTFYMLTGTHALHVIGGLVLLAVVTYKAWRGVYSSTWYPGIRYSVMYWHYLDVVWLIMFAVLYLF